MKLEIEELLKIKNRSDITSFEVLNQFEDDHLQCAECKINDIKIGFYWYDTIGFLEYWDESDKAFEALLSAIKIAVEVEYDCMDDS